MAKGEGKEGRWDSEGPFVNSPNSKVVTRPPSWVQASVEKQGQKRSEASFGTSPCILEMVVGPTTEIFYPNFW